MNKVKILVVIIGIVLAAGGLFALLKNNSSKPMHSADTQRQNKGQYSEFLQDANISSTVDKSPEKNVSITIENFTFSPTIITISKGAVITWTNRDSVRHNVISADTSPHKGLSSELLSKNETYSYTFSKSGTYYYMCTPHPSQMRGVIIVK